MMASISRLASVLFIAGASWVAVGLGGGPLGSGMAWAQSKAIQSQESNVSGVSFEITEMRRKEGVLTVRVRLVNSSATEGGFSLGRPGGTYVTAGSKKFFVLKDTEGAELHGSRNQSVPKGAAHTWWAKFPAPGPEVKKVNFYTEYTPPFEDIPIAD
jgi:hypothetical protein